jgi:hypothetical protein
MPVSIVDYEHLIKDPMTLGLYKNLLRMGDVVKVFPVVDVGSLVVRGERWHTLPTHSFRKLNAGFTETTGTLDNQEDKLAIFGGKFQVDKVLKKLKTPTLRDPSAVQFDMHSKAMERGIAYNVFMGDVDTTPDGFDGIMARMADARFPTRQYIDAATLHVLATQDNAKTFIDLLDTAIKYAGLGAGGAKNGSPRGAIFVNETGWVGIQRAFRKADYQLATFDYLGYTWDTYRGLPIIDVGYQRDMTTEIIPGDILVGGHTNGTYVVVCRFAEPDGDLESPGSDGLTLVQAGGIETIGPEDHNLYEVYDFQWVLGLSHVGDDYCASALYNITFSAT